jgi:phage terminase small subunit
MADGLTARQARFVAEYCVSLNATSAAIKAGYSDKGADSWGAQLLSNPKVRAEIAKKTGKVFTKLEISAERVLEEIAKLAFFDPRKLFESDGSPKQLHELDDETAMAVAGFEFVELFEGTGDEKHAYGLLKKYKLTDKRASLELLGKYLKLFVDRTEVSGEIGIRTVLVPAPAKKAIMRPANKPEFDDSGDK